MQLANLALSHLGWWGHIGTFVPEFCDGEGRQRHGRAMHEWWDMGVEVEDDGEVDDDEDCRPNDARRKR